MRLARWCQLHNLRELALAELSNETGGRAAHHLVRSSGSDRRRRRAETRGFPGTLAPMHQERRRWVMPQSFTALHPPRPATGGADHVEALGAHVGDTRYPPTCCLIDTTMPDSTEGPGRRITKRFEFRR